MEKIEIYNPFQTKDYKIVKEDGKRSFCIDDMKLELSEEGYIPKSGLLFDKALDVRACENKKVLDLGCGYLGILGIIAYLRNAKQIDSIDYDPKCVEWFNKLIKENHLEKFHCFESNYYQNVEDIDYDVILANPPQMPMIEGSVHDSGGIDGRDYIIHILENSIHHMKKGGNLYMLLFDFLGVEQRMSDEPSIVEIADDLGYHNPEIVFEADKIIKKGSVTYESIPHIQMEYPYYHFEDDLEDKKCSIKILRLEK